ncbi:MAG TPA: hypothetical protein VGK67_38565 [Myxococcales bacterium]|jgi:ferritin-like metal-binding protein YciE
MSELKMNRLKLLDKLGERWLFEKKTVFLYDKIIRKLESLDYDFDVSQLRSFRNQELEHQKQLESYIELCGSNAKRKTPSQRAVEIESLAFANIIEESREASQVLHVLLDAEMEDNASWELLIQLAKRAGQKDLIAHFQKAWEEEKVHLRTVRGLILKLARYELVEMARPQPLAP